MNLVQKILLGYTFAQSALLYALLFVIINIYSVYSILVFGFQMILKRQVLRLILTLKISVNIEFNLTLTVKFQLFLSRILQRGSSTDFKTRGKELVQPEFAVENDLILLTRSYQLILLSYLRSQGKQAIYSQEVLFIMNN